jgi:hypothetical protein
MAGQRKTLGSLVSTADTAPPRPASPDRTDKPARTARPAAPAKPAEQALAPAAVAARPSAESAMTMRSWYMPKASADRLAALVDDVHFATRLPKHLIMGAVVNVLDRRRDEIEAEARAVGGNG